MPRRPSSSTKACGSRPTERSRLPSGASSSFQDGWRPTCTGICLMPSARARRPTTSPRGGQPRGRPDPARAGSEVPRLGRRASPGGGDPRPAILGRPDYSRYKPRGESRGAIPAPAGRVMLGRPLPWLTEEPGPPRGHGLLRPAQRRARHTKEESMRTVARFVAAVVAAGLAVPLAASAQEVTLKVVSAFPETSTYVKRLRGRGGAGEAGGAGH